MRIYCIVFLFLWAMPLQAQHTISGTFAPAKDYTWLLAYHLTPSGQNYVADTAIKDGQFTLNIDATKPIGIYRLVYAVPQEEFYFDIIYNGKEAVELHFDSLKGVNFINSQENIPYGTYFKEINDLERELLTFYTTGSTDVKEYLAIVRRLTSLQSISETQSEGLLAHAFISANRPYLPTAYETLADLVAHRKEHYFDAFDLTDTTLQASGFLIDKLENYVFTALPLKEMSATETETAMQENTAFIYDKLKGVNDSFKYAVFNTLWSQAVAGDLDRLSDFIYSNYLKELALATDNSQTVLDIEVHNRLRLGAMAPEMVWKENNAEHRLSSMEGGENYLLVFWSSQCGHCLKELPVLHKELQKHPALKVLAVGLEDDDITWTKESAKIPNFAHIISLGKWDSEYADLYAIQRTPTYFILDAEKRIIAKPESDREVIAFLEAKK
ncbi:AhpC/TSA family protein [Maribacter sp.]|nr:AhpC/TSA family protein [Maribacter sp.]